MKKGPVYSSISFRSYYTKVVTKVDRKEVNNWCKNTKKKRIKKFCGLIRPHYICVVKVTDRENSQLVRAFKGWSGA